MFPKESILRKSREFNRVYREGKRFRGEGFSLIVLENGERRSRIGVSIHRKLKGAVKRNRIKRIVRESFRLHQRQYPVNCDIVFAIRPDFNAESPQEIIQVVAQIVSPTSVS